MKINASTRLAISRGAAIGVIIIIILAGAVGIYYVSTTPGTTTSSSSTTPAQARKDTIVIGTTDSVQTTIDPADAYDYFAQNVVILNIGAGLVSYKPGSSNYLPDLATDWSVSSDGTVWTFNLRHNVQFSDGTPFNATTVKYSVDREFAIQEAEGPFVGAGVGGTGPQCCGVLNHTEISGQYQVKFFLNVPFAPFLGMVAFQALWPVNPNVAPMPAHPSPGTNVGVINYTGNVATENPNGLGPYTLTKWDRSAGKDIEMDFKANTHYWNYSATWPKTQNIIFKFYTDSTSLALALTNGEIDMAYRQLAATDISSFKANSALKVWEGPGAFIQYLVFDQTNTALTQNVRQAVAAAINRSAIVSNVFQGAAQNLYSMIPLGMSYHTDDFKTAYGDANVAKAQSLLSAAGYSSSHKLIVNLTYPTGHYASTDGISLQIKQALENTGMVTVNLASSPWTTYKSETKSDQLQVYIYGWYPDYVDPYDYMVPFFPADGIGFLHTNWTNSTMTNVLTTIASTSDTGTLNTLYGKAQGILAQAAPTIPLFQGTSIAATNAKVSGVVLDITIWFRFSSLQETA